MKSKNIFTFSAMLFSLLILSPKNYFAQTRLNVKINFTEQETRELEKMKKAGVLMRTTNSMFAQGTNPTSKKIEEFVFNDKGLLTEKTRFTSYGPVDEKMVYKYNKKGELISRTLYNGEDVVLEKEDYKLDKSGRAIEIKAETLVRGKVHKTKRTMKYDKNGTLLETKAFEGGKDFVIKEVMDYKDGLLMAKRLSNFKKQPLGYEIYQYDDQKRKIKETAANIIYKPELDSTTNKMMSVAYEEKLEFLFKYDDKNRITEIKGTEYRQVFSYNDNGDFIRDTIFDNGGKKQNDNEFIYGEDGLLKRIVRYYGDGTPGAYIDYTYQKKK